MSATRPSRWACTARTASDCRSREPTRAGNAYRVATLQVAPQTENVYLTFKDGWHLAEMAPDNASNEWHWTKKDATISFKNPKRNSCSTSTWTPPRS